MKAIIFGAGYAGLFAAYELEKHNQEYIVLEKNNEPGGLSRTFKLDNLNFDIGPHIYFNKQEEIRNIWKELIKDKLITIKRHNKIFYDGTYINSPLKPFNAISKLGLLTTIKIFLSFFKSKLSKRQDPENSKEWVIQNFGEELYLRFFKIYNEKIWGLDCEDITANWAGQRIKASLFNMIYKSLIRKDEFIIKTFDYPINGSNTIIKSLYSKINQSNLYLENEIHKTFIENNNIVKIESINLDSGKVESIENFKNVISTIPVDQLIKSFQINIPNEVNLAIKKLTYRHLILVNISIPKNYIKSFNEQWIDIHDPKVKALRLTNFANYNCKMDDDKNAPVTLEYNCFDQDIIWKLSDEDIFEIVKNDLIKLNYVNGNLNLKYKVIRIKNAYPVYYKGYEKDTEKIFDFISSIKNLQSIGRLGMYKWNNMHHSVQTGILAVKNLNNENHNLWNIKGMVSIGKEYSE